MMGERPTTITVRQYYRNNYILKVAKKECVVSVPSYTGSWVEDVEDLGGFYSVKFQDHEGPHSLNFYPDDTLSVNWLTPATTAPQTVTPVADGVPETQHDLDVAVIMKLLGDKESLQTEITELTRQLAVATARAEAAAGERDAARVALKPFADAYGDLMSELSKRDINPYMFLSHDDLFDEWVVNYFDADGFIIMCQSAAEQAQTATGGS